ncbi:hypothetical protein FACS1894106_1700 [Spirochaetia bacterium]|nr:hypothetical protein FACS1894106_1700 [Spirochaetia bacterium]
MKIKEMSNNTWLDKYPVDIKYLLEISFDDNDPDFGVDAVPSDVRRKSQLSAIIKAAIKTNNLNIAEAAKNKNADPIKLYGMLKRADEIEALPQKMINGQSKVFA